MSRQGSSRGLSMIAACTLIAFAVADRRPFVSVAAAEDSDVPRTLMRLPQWIESLGEVPGSVRPKSAFRKDAATAPPPSAVGAGEAAAADRRPIAPAEAGSPRIMTPEAAAELGMPGGSSRAIAGKPGRAMLRSRGPRAVEGYVTLTGGWAELSGNDSEPEVEEAASDKEPSSEPPPADRPPPQTGLGPDASVLNRNRTVGASGKTPSTPTSADPSPTDFGGSRNDSPVPATDDGTGAGPVGIGGPPTETAAARRLPESVSVKAAAPTAAAPDETPTLAIDPASFRGVLPGKTTREELIAGWGDGEPFVREDGSSGLAWKVEPFERVEVVVERDTVSSIFIRLDPPVPVAELSRQLELSDLRTVTVLDENGVSVGEVFPERGVIFSMKPGTHAAIAVMLEPLDAESFVLRAEADLDVSVANSFADLQYAIEIEPSHVRAHRLLLVILSDQGRWAEAAAAAAAAAKLDPTDTWTRIKHASALLSLDRIEEARSQAEGILERKGNPPLVVAQIERLLGRIELAEVSPDHEKAVSHFARAIKTSAPLANAKSHAVRRAALDLQLDCHLGTALAIAGGNWQQKSRVLPKWIERSEGFAKKLGTEVGGGDFVELRLCEGVLAVAARSNDVTETLPWVKRTMEVRGRLGERITDPWRRRQIDWQVGQALSLALTAAQNRGESKDLLENATLTAAYLERGSQMRQLTMKEQRALGDLFFRIGILHSLQNGDHATAVTWFDRTVPLWKDDAAFRRTGDLGRLGESYVSMAISYWQVEKREEAVALSRLGVDCMVEAVERRQLDERSLAVAYGNLSTMYAEQGNNEQSKAYAEMASRAESTGTVVR